MWQTTIFYCLFFTGTSSLDQKQISCHHSWQQLHDPVCQLQAAAQEAEVVCSTEESSIQNICSNAWLVRIQSPQLCSQMWRSVFVAALLPWGICAGLCGCRGLVLQAIRASSNRHRWLLRLKPLFPCLGTVTVHLTFRLISACLSIRPCVFSSQFCWTLMSLYVIVWLLRCESFVSVVIVNPQE